MDSRNAHLINFPLNNQSSTTGWDELFKHFLKVFRDLFERSFDRFILPLIQNLDKLLDRLCRRVKVLAALDELVPLFREVIVLLECLLVDVPELLEAIVNFL